MSPVEVHQFLPALFTGDAVGNHTLLMRLALRRAGMGGQIWAEHFDPHLFLTVRHHRRYRGGGRRNAGKRRVALYQASTGSERLADLLIGTPLPLALYYHNITPAAFFEPYDGVAAMQMRRAREELERLAARSRLAFAGSRFSATELTTLGVDDVRFLPPFAPSQTGDCDWAYLRHLHLGKKGIDVLFVGRVMPHKGHSALIRVAALLRAGAGLPTRLFIVGPDGPHTYLASLHRLVDKLGLQEVVVFAGLVTQRRLAAHYRAADVFLCMSEHEGFCLPLAEAMQSGLPVVACERGAVAETLDGAGVLLAEPDPLVAAEVVVRVTTDEGLRRQLVARGIRQAAVLGRFRRDEVLVDALRELGDA